MFTTRDLEKKDIPDALMISLKELGSDYLSEKDFYEVIDSEKGFCIIVLNDDKVAGFAICQLFGPDKVDDMLCLPNGCERGHLLSKRKIGLFDSVSVSDTERGKGIGTMLAKACMERFRSEGTDTVTAMAWEDFTGHCNIRHILINTMGMIPSIAIRGYWNFFVESTEGHNCPMCGAPCRCYGRLHYVDLFIV